MNPSIGRAVILTAMTLMVVIRSPHVARSRKATVARSAKDRREVALQYFTPIGFLAPLIWAVSPVLPFADYPLRLAPMLAGVAYLALGLWFFHRSHVDLGTNWSVTLEIRERHRLVSDGVYRSVRHPLYSALLLYGVGQALVVPNWLIGPTFFVVFAILFALRVHAEERLMLETFGSEYAAYMARTKRLVPGVW